MLEPVQARRTLIDIGRMDAYHLDHYSIASLQVYSFTLEIPNILIIRPGAGADIRTNQIPWQSMQSSVTSEYWRKKYAINGSFIRALSETKPQILARTDNKHLSIINQTQCELSCVPTHPGVFLAIRISSSCQLAGCSAGGAKAPQVSSLPSCL